MGGKRIIRTPEEKEVFEYIKKLNSDLDKMRTAVLSRASEILGYDLSVGSLHGKIGGKNNTYTNVADDYFPDVKTFQKKWAQGMLDEYTRKAYPCAVWDLIRLYQDDLVREYILLFQERNYFKHIEERQRLKPDHNLWEVWFGSQVVMGLLIAPAKLPDGSWRIDHSEIRRAQYEFWTIGHIIKVGGLINAETNQLYRIDTLEDFISFYQNIVYSLSNSQYEKAINTRYIQYLQNSVNPNAEPFLIPELRYEGKNKQHKYRLDFTILNPYTFEYTGFELSPASTHIHVEKVAGKSQADLNKDLSRQWQKECSKRKDYFREYGINTITFADEDLKNIDDCFSEIAEYLQKRGCNSQLSDVLDKIKQITI